MGDPLKISAFKQPVLQVAKENGFVGDLAPTLVIRDSSLPSKQRKTPPSLMNSIVATFGLHWDLHCPVLPKLQRTS